MAHTRPVNLFGRTRLKVYGPDTTTALGEVYTSGTITGKHSKVFGESALSLTVSVAEEILASDETALEGAFVVPEVWFDAGWMAFATPFMLSPGSGKVRGGDSKRQQNPVAIAALHALLDECIAFPHECDPDHATFRRGGGLERNVYYNFGHKGYSESLHTWHDANEYDPTGLPKDGKPTGWPTVLSAAKPIFRNVSEGGRTCFRPPRFTLDVDQRVVFVWVSDEPGKLGVSGPNQGGIVIDWDADEDGWQQGFGHKTLRLKAGEYQPWGWMLTINSEGGDGNDSARIGAYSIKTDGSGDVDQVLFVSDASTRVLRQPISDQLPGMSPGETIRRMLQECSDQGSEAADLLLANRTFTDTLDTAEADWTTFVEWVLPWGYSLASGFADMLAEIDLDMGPAFSFDAWEDRGGDHGSTPGTGLSTVELTRGASPATALMNVVDYTSESDPAGPNAYLTESQEGSGLYEGTVPDGQRRRFGSLESGASGTVGRANRNAHKAVKANGEARRYYSGTIIAVTNAVPYVHFNLCDVVHGRGYRDLGLDLEVTAMSWSQSDALKVTLDLSEPTT